MSSSVGAKSRMTASPAVSLAKRSEMVPIANPKTFLPNGKWPGAVFNWVILLSFDQDGRLIPANTKRITEHLMPGDS
jgi:hypothetical protein